MFDRLEGSMMRWVGRCRFAIIARAHPQLERLDTEKARDWALWFAGGNVSGWWRLLEIALILIIGPALLIAIVLIGLDVLRWRLGGAWPFVFLGGWMAGVLITAFTIELWRGRGAGRACYRAMRLFGYDVCPHCGYEMRGHECGPGERRQCPECGGMVASLDL